MTVKTTLSFTDRHHRFLMEKVEEGVFATASAAVGAAVERLMQDETDRDVALNAMADEIRARMLTPREDYLDKDAVFAAVRTRLQAKSER